MIKILKLHHCAFRCKNSEDTKKIRTNVPYIKKVLKNHGIDEKPRVEIDNIHKIKGLTFNNVIVNLSVYKTEKNINESERLAYTAYSRGETDCWSIGSEEFHRYDRHTSLGGVQHDRGRVPGGGRAGPGGRGRDQRGGEESQREQHRGAGAQDAY